MTDAELTLDALERLGGKCVTFYVGPGGDDGNSGRSWSERMVSWRKAYKLCLDGDVIVTDYGPFPASFLGQMDRWLNGDLSV